MRCLERGSGQLVFICLFSPRMKPQTGTLCLLCSQPASKFLGILRVFFGVPACAKHLCSPQVLLWWVGGTGIWGFVLQHSFSSWEFDGFALLWLVSNSSGLGVSKFRVMG